MNGAMTARTIATMNRIAGGPPPCRGRRHHAPAAAPEREAEEEVGQERDRADEHRDEQREPDVVVPDVGQLVADDALELLAIELLEEARS